MKLVSKCILYGGIFLSLAASAQQQGIVFQQDLNWRQIQAQAQATNKYIFVDCYATWCKPCRYMSQEIFPRATVGSFFNDKFISVQVQMDTTAADNAQVKSWYADAHSIMDTYKIAALPTYLFFSPEGKLVHRAIGAWQAPEELINRAAAALNPTRQYYTLLNAYHNGARDTAAMKYLALTALELDDKATAMELGNAYIAHMPDVYTRENLAFISRFTTTRTDKGFTLFLQHPDKVNAIMGPSYADEKTMNIILKEEDAIKALFAVTTTTSPADWNTLYTTLEEKYPAAIAKRTVSWVKVPYYEKQRSWLAYAQCLDAYLACYAPAVNPNLLNNFSWKLFENATDPKALAIAIKWSKQAIAQHNSDTFIDTYANLLYKIGDIQNAIAWEEKAVKMNPKENGYLQALEKMRKKEKTWE